MLINQIKEDMQKALREKDALRLTTLRGLIAACAYELTATGRTPQDTLSDEEVHAVIRREVKRRHEATTQYEKGGRPELAQKERDEAAVLSSYLPAALPREEIEKAAREKMASLDITDKKDMGRLMGALMQELKPRGADGATVKEVVERLLS